MRLLTDGFIVTLTLSLLAIALAAMAQPAGQVHHIGLLSTGSPQPWTIALAEAFRQGLRDCGSVEGQHILITGAKPADLPVGRTAHSWPACLG